MKIIELTYSRLVSFGNYQNATFGAKAEVGEEDAETAFDVLVRFVEAKANGVQQVRDEEADTRRGLEEARWQKNAIMKEIELLMEKASRLKELLAKHGVEMDYSASQYDPSVPF